jgi:rhodanese-related sulfurtransferase
MPKSYADLVREAKAVVREVSVAEARRLHDADGSTIFVDVREPEEVRRGTIPGSLAIPRGILEGHLADFVPSYDVPLVLFCASGNRSALAGKTLLEMGYTNVANLAGGIRAWALEGHPVGAPAFP